MHTKIVASILAVLSLIGVILAAYNTHKMKACSCSSGYNPERNNILPLVLLAIAMLSGLIAIFAKGNILIALFIIAVISLLVAAATSFREMHMTESCNCGSYKPKNMSLATAIVSLIALIPAILGFIP